MPDHLPVLGKPLSVLLRISCKSQTRAISDLNHISLTHLSSPQGRRTDQDHQFMPIYIYIIPSIIAPPLVLRQISTGSLFAFAGDLPHAAIPARIWLMIVGPLPAVPVLVSRLIIDSIDAFRKRCQYFLHETVYSGDSVFLDDRLVQQDL